MKLVFKVFFLFTMLANMFVCCDAKPHYGSHGPRWPDVNVSYFSLKTVEKL
jgi:hypothetical protein